MSVPLTTKQLDFKTIFHSLQAPYIVFDIDDPSFTILDENEAHAKVALVKRADVVGRPLLDAFPDTSEAYKNTGKSQLLESLRRVVKTGEPDSMPNLKYDLRDKKGNYTPKFWSVTHFPILDDGKVTAIYQETRDITDEVLIGERLDRTQHQLDQILESALVGTWHWDFKRELVTTDSNLARMFGISVSQARKGLPLERFIQSVHPNDQERVQNEINEVISSGKPFETDYRTIAAKGEVRWVIARGYVQYDQHRNPLVFSGIIIDVTDRKRAEHALVASEKRLSFLANSMPQLVWVTRPDGYHEYYNQRWYDYTGTKPGSTDGEGWNDLFHPDDQARAWKIWRRSLKTGQPYEIEYRLYHAPSGQYRWNIGRALPFRDDSGKITKWYGTCTDIHEQKHAAEIQAFLADISKQLSSTLDYKKMLRRVTKVCVPAVADWCSIDLYSKEKGFEQVSVAHANPKKRSDAIEYRQRNPIHIDDPNGIPNILRTNKSEYYPLITDELLEAHIENKKTLAFMKSLSLRSIIIAPIRINDKPIGGISFISSDSGRYFTEDDLKMTEELAARISLAISNSKLYADSLHDLKERQKLEKELLLEKQKLESRVKERTMQLQLTNQGLRDEIVKRHATEEALQQQSEELERSNAELEDFAYVASHDLQEPLRKIQAFSNLLKSEFSDKLGEGAYYVDRMDAAAGRMSILIQDLLSFSRISTQAKKSESVDLNEVVSGVVQDLEARIDEVGGKVVVKRLPRVAADPTHARQLFQNLIGNALKFHKPGVTPHVEISARSQRNFVEIQVSDNGIGFDEKYLDRIFSVFQRLHGRDKYEGTGIGLAVCRKIVERYGGTITAESIKGKGSTFIVRLPNNKEKK